MQEPGGAEQQPLAACPRLSRNLWLASEADATEISDREAQKEEFICENHVLSA